MNIEDDEHVGLLLFYMRKVERALPWDSDQRLDNSPCAQLLATRLVDDRALGLQIKLRRIVDELPKC